MAGLVDTLAKHFPNVEFISTGPEYKDIVWLGDTIISEQQIQEKMVETLRTERINKVREESVAVRAFATEKIVGTSDYYMLRTYDLKRSEAYRYKIATDPQDTDFPALYQEAMGTGVTVKQLAEAVLEQYDLSAKYLNPILGQIEAIRRSKIVELNQAVSIEELQTVSEPTWPDLSNLQMI